MTREEWLEAAIDELAPRLPALPPVLVSVGWPKGARTLRGQCWHGEAARDEKTHHIFITPAEESGAEVMRILLHELVHAAVGVDAKHGKEFSRLAKKLGFDKPWTKTPAGEALKQELRALAEKLGKFPTVGLMAPEKKQTTRMKLYSCACNIKIRKAGPALNAQCLDCGERFWLVEKTGNE